MFIEIFEERAQVRSVETMSDTLKKKNKAFLLEFFRQKLKSKLQ